jgi:hypothetical protein
MAQKRDRPERRSVSRIPKVRRVDVTSDEFNRLIEVLNERGALIRDHDGVLVAIRRDLDVQFKRIAQLQAETDEIKRTLKKLIS